MNKQVVKITIKKDGSYNLEALEGFSGQSCREKTRDLELVLGGEAVATENKSTYYDGDGAGEMDLNLNI